MMASTPHKSVQWSNKNEVNEFVYGSPYSEASSTDSINASSTLQYINSQLVAHGFIRGSGVSFDGLSREDADRLSKCVLGMLSQRNEDMSRVEELSTKLRTLSYEHERLASMQRTTSEQLAAAERETNLFKSRLAASNKSLQASEVAHKATSAELQRNRSTIQSVRQTYAAELKRREKETEKMIDRWQKISEAQTKLGSGASGIKFKSTLANPAVSSRNSDIIGKGPDILEDALDEAQAARKELIEENTSLKNVLLSAANEVSRICHTIHTRMGASTGDEAPRLTISEMFSISAPESASEKFNALLTSFQGVVTRIGVDCDPESTTPLGVPPQSSLHAVQESGEKSHHHAGAGELVQLQAIIGDLRRQLEQAQVQKEAGAYADQAQAIIRRFLNDEDEKSTVQEKQLLEKIRKELDYARKKVDEAALALKDEKAMLEAERQAFHREQRLWRSQMSIPHGDDAPSKPTGLGAYFEAPAEPLDLPFSPPRPSRPRKINSSPKKVMGSPRRPVAAAPCSPARPSFAVGKVSKRSGPPKKPSGSLLGASSMRAKVIPPMETEVMPTAPALPTTVSSQSLVVPNSFVLPPPSPLASIPANQSELLPMKSTVAPSDDVHEELSDRPNHGGQDPTTKRPFPVAKPLAEHMIHAYSPARPSPLSRLLMLANSPAQSASAPDNIPFGLDAPDDGLRPDIGPSGSGPTVAMMLEEELGINEDNGGLDDSPLRDKGRRGIAHVDPGVRDKLKSKSSVLKRSSKTAIQRVDKENGFSRTSRAQRPPPPVPSVAKQSVTVRPLINGKGGARRVPIGSVDAAPIGPGWK